jgi:hypothetical protein
MLRTCITHKREEESINKFSVDEKAHQEGLDVDLTEIGRGGMGWIHLAQDGDQWPALVNTVMNIRVP